MRKTILGVVLLLLMVFELLILYSTHNPSTQKKTGERFCGYELPTPPGLEADAVRSNCRVGSVLMYFHVPDKMKAEGILAFYQDYLGNIGWKSLDGYSGNWEEMVCVAEKLTKREVLITAWSSPDEALIGTIILMNVSRETLFPWEDNYRATFKIDPYIHDIQPYITYLEKGGNLDKLMHALEKYKMNDGSYDTAKAAKENPDNAYILFYNEMAQTGVSNSSQRVAKIQNPKSFPKW